MLLDLNGLIDALSYALDKEEAEFFSIREGHGKRVAFISSLLGKKIGLSPDQLSDLSILSVLHDSALTRFKSEERSGKDHPNLGKHCIYGEKNTAAIPFKTDVKGAVLFHH